MINFVDDKWNFPDKRKNLEKDENYLFFKNGQVTSSQIIDFSSTRRVFQFDPSEEVPVDRIRRIYFAKGVPDELMNEGQGERKENARFGTFRSVDLRSGQEIFYEEGWYDQEIDVNNTKMAAPEAFRPNHRSGGPRNPPKGEKPSSPLEITC
jgi:hypothetical protein